MKTKTKTKPALRARKMFANYYPEGTICWPTKRKALIRSGPSRWHRAVPVAVIPLDDAQALIDLATSAHYNAVQAHPYHVPTPGAMAAALTAIGVLPKSKGGRK
jgi:hypothetical protein